jgi:hypothetical protein
MHTHTLYNGVLIIHSHLYKKDLTPVEKTGSPSHTHSMKELFFIDQMMHPVFTLLTILVFFLLFNSKGISYFSFYENVKSFNLIKLTYLRAPPLQLF